MHELGWACWAALEKKLELHWQLPILVGFCDQGIEREKGKEFGV